MDSEKAALAGGSAPLIGDVSREFVSQEAADKFRCKVPGCTKLFKGEYFWRKHFEKRHAELFESQRAKLLMEQRQTHHRRRPWRFFVAVVVGLVLFMFIKLASPPQHEWRTVEDLLQFSEVLSSDKKVKLEAHIMSKCPDAEDCLLDLVVPAMANVSDKVDFALSYIGQINSEDNSVECKHGPEECLGNIIELCAANLYPDPKISLGFTACLTKDYDLIPQKELIRNCALEHGLDFDDLNDCASKDDGAFGMDLLRNSVARTANAGVTLSCTVRINEEIRCIRDGGEWKDCPGGHKVKDLIKDIERAYDDSD